MRHTRFTQIPERDAVHVLVADDHPLFEALALTEALRALRAS